MLDQARVVHTDTVIARNRLSAASGHGRPGSEPAFRLHRVPGRWPKPHSFAVIEPKEKQIWQYGSVLTFRNHTEYGQQ